MLCLQQKKKYEHKWGNREFTLKCKLTCYVKTHESVHSATRHNIHMYPYFLFTAIHHLNRPRLSLSDLVAQSAE